MDELNSPPSFNINIPEEFDFGLSKGPFSLDTNFEFIDEYDDQDEFERPNANTSDNNRDFYENDNIFESQSQLLDLPIVQLLMNNTKLNLDTSLIFENWEEVELFMDTYSEQQGFENKKVRTEKDKDGQIKKRRFDCEHSGKYKPKKVAIIENQRNTTSKKTECGFRVNFSYTKIKGFISITNYIEAHNGHDLNPKFVDFYSKYRRMTDDMMKQIKLFTKCNLDMAQQRSMLKELFPNCTILSQDLSNAIQRVKYEEANIENDVVRLLEWLIAKKEEDSRLFVRWEINHHTRRLEKIFWMSAEQIDTWISFSDVILNDNTMKTNRYNMPLSLFVCINNHRQSRLVAQALVNDETINSYRWILNCTKEATGRVILQVFCMDADPAMITAIGYEYSKTNVIHCIYHISQNLPRNLKGKLGERYQQFIQDFYKCRNTISNEEFLIKWQQLKEKYPSAGDYLVRALESSQKSWARCYTSTIFVAGVQSTQRVEGYNSVIKRVVNGNTTLWQLAQCLNERISIEMQKIEYQEFKDSNALIGLPNLATQLFPRIDQIIKTYLTPELLSLQRAQMNQATLYYCCQLTIDEMHIAKHQEADEFGADFIENHSESRQMELDTLIAQCEIDLVASIWEIKQYNTTKTNYIILLKNRTHMCSCMTLITMGLYCRHFFQVMLHTTEAFFYIKLISIRWFKDNYMHLDPSIVAASEPFITTQGDHVAEANYLTNGIVFQIRGDLSNDDEKAKVKARRIRDLYGKISSIFKEALKKAVDDKDSSLYNVINKWIIEKELVKQREGESSMQLHNTDNLNYTEDVLPPAYKRHKGRVAHKRIKSSIESSVRNTALSDKSNIIAGAPLENTYNDQESKESKTIRRCKKCNGIGHYAKTCTASCN